MAFNIPNSPQQVIDRASTDVQNALPTSNPFFKNSFLGAIIFSFAGRIYDFYLQLNILITQLFVDTATDTFLERWGTYKGITRNPATQSIGIITAIGTPGVSIPISTQFSDPAGNLFATTSSETITSTTVSIASLIFSGGVVTATASSSIQFASGQLVAISGASPSDYNGTFSITVISDTEFTYNIATSPGGASGTILANANLASLPVQSLAFGESQNEVSGTQLILTSPISGVNDNAIVQFDAITGGTDLESDTNLRNRIISIYQNPISHFNINEIVSKAEEVPGVTRVFVYESGSQYGNESVVTSINRSGQVATVVTAAPHGLEDCMNITIFNADQPDYNVTSRALVVDSVTFVYIVENSPTSPATGSITFISSIPLGQVAVFFTRDNDVDIIPSPSDVTTVKNELITILPANTSVSDLIVKAPDPVVVNFIFTSLSPNTPTMQSAITANLTSLFQQNTSVGSDLKSYAYNAAIYQTIDPATANVVQDFTLSIPTGTISIAAGQIPTLGSITYP